MLRRGSGIESDYESQVLLSKIYLRAGHAQDAVRILELMLSRWPGHQAELIWRTACIQAAFLGKESRGLHMVKNLYRTDPDRLEYIEIYMYFLAVHRRDFIRINRISRDVPGLYRGGYYGGDILIPFELRTHFNERRIALNIYRYVMQAKWQLGMREEAARLLHNLDYRLGVDADRTRSGGERPQSFPLYLRLLPALWRRHRARHEYFPGNAAKLPLPLLQLAGML